MSVSAIGAPPALGFPTPPSGSEDFKSSDLLSTSISEASSDLVSLPEPLSLSFSSSTSPSLALDEPPELASLSDSDSLSEDLLSEFPFSFPSLFSPEAEPSPSSPESTDSPSSPLL